MGFTQLRGAATEQRAMTHASKPSGDAAAYERAEHPAAREPPVARGERSAARGERSAVRSTVSVGREYEDAAVEVLRGAGFEVLWRNLRIGHLEVDLVARRDDLVVIVEVRYRGGSALDTALASVTRQKRARLLRAARGLWRGRLSKMQGISRVRLDVIAINPSGTKWIEGAFTE
ncbi:MAG: YraN family protein [Labilithrix sp.]|nr:YraN family protein [Labilithrix sp.]MCW5812967.1 YraN family protein [Labilithrix sp.]